MAIKLGGLELGTPGDIIVGGGGYAVGFAVDAFFFSGGATSAASAGACAAGALGLKYAIQRTLDQRKKPSSPESDMQRQPESTPASQERNAGQSWTNEVI